MLIETKQALMDVRNTVREWGEPLDFFIRSEEDVKRGSLGSPVSHSTKSVRVYAYPIERVTTEKQLTKAGLSEQCNTIVYTAALSWKDLDINNFDVSRMTVGYDGREWQVSQLGKVGKFGGEYQYITFGLK